MFYVVFPVDICKLTTDFSPTPHCSWEAKMPWPCPRPCPWTVSTALSLSSDALPREVLSLGLGLPVLHTTLTHTHTHTMHKFVNTSEWGLVHISLWLCFFFIPTCGISCKKPKNSIHLNKNKQTNKHPANHTDKNILYVFCNLILTLGYTQNTNLFQRDFEHYP